MSWAINDSGWERELDRYLTTAPDDDMTPVCVCSICGAEIYEGDDYYEVNDEAFCEDCMVDTFRKTAEFPDYESED